MQVKEEKGVVFWDRVVAITRKNSEGEVLQKGSVGGQNIVRIHEGERGGYFMTASCVMQQLLNAHITQWPSAVSEDGCTVTLWLFDYSLGRGGIKREFKMSFFDEYACAKFFITYTSCLPNRARRRGGESFEALRYGYKGQGEEDSDDSEKNDGGDDDDGRDDGDDDGDEEEAEEEENNIEQEGRNIKDKELERILALEENLGYSQNLFVPLSPSGMK